MKKIAIHGVAGRMGSSIAQVLRDDADAELSAAMDRPDCVAIGKDVGTLIGGDALGVQVTSNLEAFLQGVEVVIDFSAPVATAKLVPLCAAQGIPLVIGTTGLDEPTLAAVKRGAERVPVVFAPNYSQGVTALFELARRAAAHLGPAFQAEIVEIHHRHKVDAPSGTALRLAEVVAEARHVDLDRVGAHSRSGQVGPRPDDEIGVMALRGGDVVGEHTLLFIGDGERLELTHRATDRAIFARGAVRAAHWVHGKAAGLYDMADVMGF